MSRRKTSPAALAADPNASGKLARWGGKYLAAAKVAALVESARGTVGVRQGEWDRRRLCEYAQHARQARRDYERSRRRLQDLAKEQPVIQAQGQAVGAATACVLWMCTGDPRSFSSAGAYRKAMGLNLTERSSGKYQGELKISKRGNPRSRQWLYFAALRLVQKAGVQAWYQAKKARDAGAAKRALVAVMRKLALALYHIGVRPQEFDAHRLFRGVLHKQQRQRSVRNTRAQEEKSASADAVL